MSTPSSGSEDWRRCPHRPYLDRAQIVRRPWRETRPGWDHDHCEFCFVTFDDGSRLEALHEGLCTLDEYHWFCEKCVRDLDDEYHFVILQEATVPTVEDIRIRYEITNRPSPGTKLGRSLMAYDGSGRELESSG